MPTPSRPVSLVKKHLTKAEINQRKNLEKELISGKPIREWPQTRSNDTAHKHFRRIVSLYRSIGKNDALTEPVLNRYCIMQAECEDFEAKREEIYNTCVKLRAKLESYGEDCDITVLADISGKIGSLYKTMISVDRQIQAKRKMLLDIERESIMTLASQMRSVPKKVQEEEQPSGVAAFQKRRSM